MKLRTLLCVPQKYDCVFMLYLCCAQPYVLHINKNLKNNTYIYRILGKIPIARGQLKLRVHIMDISVCAYAVHVVRTHLSVIYINAYLGRVVVCCGAARCCLDECASTMRLQLLSNLLTVFVGPRCT